MGEHETSRMTLDSVAKALNELTKAQKRIKVCEYVRICRGDYVTTFYCNDPKLKDLLTKYNVTSIDCHNHDDVSGYRGGCECFEDSGKSLAEKLDGD